MDEAEKLLQRFETAVIYADNGDGPFRTVGDREEERDDARAAVLSAMRKGGVPDGWVLVPVEPTEEMEQAG